jgi:hypothetical protein
MEYLASAAHRSVHWTDQDGNHPGETPCEVRNEGNKKDNRALMGAMAEISATNALIFNEHAISEMITLHSPSSRL